MKFMQSFFIENNFFIVRIIDLNNKDMFDYIDKQIINDSG